MGANVVGLHWGQFISKNTLQRVLNSNRQHNCNNSIRIIYRTRQEAIMPAQVGEEEIFKTAPFDPRFPNTNQTRYCYQSYLDYHRCQKVRGTDYKPCEYFSKVFHSVCPNSWIEKWNDQREEGTFAGNI